MTTSRSDPRLLGPCPLGLCDGSGRLTVELVGGETKLGFCLCMRAVRFTLHTFCQMCRREIPDGGIYYKHPKHGIVCEYCPEFEDGGVEAPKGATDD